ncbi:hypothetical protein MTO96_000833 [Rhipicephalus appendiculatus]
MRSSAPAPALSSADRLGEVTRTDSVSERRGRRRSRRLTGATRWLGHGGRRRAATGQQVQRPAKLAHFDGTGRGKNCASF